MEKFKDINQILDFAINNEEEAYNFYTQLSAKQDNPAIKELFSLFAKEELNHKKKLQEAKNGNLAGFPANKIQNLNISEYMVDIQPRADMNYQEILILAMKKEKKAFLLYMNLVDMAEDDGFRRLFLMLAQEEAKHKLRFEIEYDNTILTDN